MNSIKNLLGYLVISLEIEANIINMYFLTFKGCVLLCNFTELQIQAMDE